MLTINLLPTKEKREIWIEETRAIIHYFAAGTVFCFIVGSILLFPSYFSLYLERRELARSLGFEEDASKELKVKESIEEMARAKILIQDLRNITEESGRTTYMLEHLFKAKGPGIVLTSVSLREKGGISVRGMAKTRRDLLDFEKALRDSGMFQDITSPISNIIRESDVNFSIDGKYKAPFGL